MLCLCWGSLPTAPPGEAARPEPFSRALREEMVAAVGSPARREEDGGQTRRQARALAGSRQPTSLPRHAHTHGFIPQAAAGYFSYVFPPRLPLCQLHKIIQKYVIPQKLDRVAAS